MIRKRWEYFVLNGNDISEGNITLNSLGMEGWELIAVIEENYETRDGDKVFDTYYYFKREPE